MVYSRRSPWPFVVLIGVCSFLLGNANSVDLIDSKSLKSSISLRRSVRSFKFSALFTPAESDGIDVASREVRTKRKRRRRRRVKKNMQKRLVSRNKKLVKRSLKHQRTNLRRIVKRSRPQKRIRRIIRHRRRRWRRIPPMEIPKMTFYAKMVIKHGRKLVKNGKVLGGTVLIKKGTKAVNQLKELEKGFQYISVGKKLLKAGKEVEGKKLIKKGTKIQKSLGSTDKIQLPGYETMNAAMTPESHNSLPVKKDVQLLRLKFIYGKKLLDRGRKLIQKGKPKEGRKLMQQAKKAIHQLKALSHGYRLILHGNKLVKAGQTKKGNELMKRGFKIKMSLGSGQFIRLPGFQTLNASRRPPPNQRKNGPKKISNRRRREAKEKKKNRSRGPARKERRRTGLVGKKNWLSKVKGKPHRRRGGTKPKLDTRGKKNNPHRSLPRKKDIALLRNKYKYGKKLLYHARKLIEQGNLKKGRKLLQQAKNAIAQLKKLDKSYRLIMHGNKLIEKGQTKRGNELMKRGFKIKMSLGSGQYIRLPGFQTMNASRRPSSKGKKKGRKERNGQPVGKGRKKNRNRRVQKNEAKVLRRKLARNPKKGLANVKKMKQFAKKLLKRCNILKRQGKLARCRKLKQTTMKALRDIEKLENAYKMIDRGEKLKKKGMTRQGNQLVKHGFKITMSLGAGAFIRLPGFQTLNAFRFPTSPTTTAPPVLPISPNKLHLEYTTSYPKTCACKLGTGFHNGVCYHMTDEQEEGEIRQCKKEACKPTYVCVIGTKTNITCIRKKNTHRTVPVGDGMCRKESFESTAYVVYAS